MSKAHFITPTTPLKESAVTVRLGTNANQFKAVDENKFVKLATESAYVLCAAGDPIEASILAVDTAPANGFSVGSIVKGETMFVIADGLQANPGNAAAIGIGDYVVCGTVSALGTKNPSTFSKVCKATNQPGAVVTSADNVVANLNAAIAKVVDSTKVALYGWRVVSLGSAGTGAVGTVLVVERPYC